MVRVEEWAVAEEWAADLVTAVRTVVTEAAGAADLVMAVRAAGSDLGIEMVALQNDSLLPCLRVCRTE